MARELTFNITEDRRRLVEPTNVEGFEITFDRDIISGSKNWVDGRIGEDAARQVFVNVKYGPNNEPYDLTGIIPEFCGLTAKGGPENRNYSIIDNWHSVMIDAQGGRFRFDFPKDAFAVAGSYKQAFFNLKREGSGDVVATLEFDMRVMSNFVYSNIVPKDFITPYIEVLDRLINEFKQGNVKKEELISELQKTVQNKLDIIEATFKSTNDTLESLKSTANYLSEKIKQDGLFTQGEAEEFENSLLKETTKIFNTVEEMKNADLVSGMTIETLGYYRISDGGGAKYIATDVMPDTFFEKSKSGLYLKLIDNDLLLNRRGARNDGTEDISDILQNAITECLKSKTNSTIRLLNGEYLVGKTIEFPIRSLNLEGIGGTAVFKSSESVSTLLHLNGDASFDETKWKNNRRFIRNISFASMNKNIIEGSAGTLIGDANNEVTIQGGACQFYFENCRWQNFDAGIVIGSNAYLFDLNKCSSYNLNTMFKSWSPWIKNSGERIGISDSTFTSCKDSVVNLTSQLDLRFKTTSFDALEGGSVLKANVGQTSHGSQIMIFDNCHFEVGKMSQSSFQISSSSNPINLKIINSRFWLGSATVDDLIDNRKIESSVVFENNEIGSDADDSVKYIGENVTISNLSMGSRGDRKPLIFSNSILTGFSNKFFDRKMQYDLNSSIRQTRSWINIQRDNSSWNADSQRSGSQNVSLSLASEVPDKSISKSIKINISNVKGYYNIDFMVPQNETGILEYGFFAKPINNFDNNIKISLIPIMWNDYDPKSFVSPTSRTVTFETNQWNKFEFNTAPYRADYNSMIGFRLVIDSTKAADDATFNMLLSSPYIRII